GHHTVAPYLAIKNAVSALEFYKKAFGAIETYKLIVPDGRLGHAEIGLGNSLIMLSDAFPEFGGKAPESLGGSPVSIHLYVEDVDAFVKKAVAAGARELKPVISSMATVRASSRIPTDTSGGSRHTRKTSHRRRCRSVCRPCSPGRADPPMWRGRR